MRSTLLLALLALLPLATAAAPAAKASAPDIEFLFHTVVPMGADGIQFRDVRQTMFLLVSAINPQFEGWRRVVDNGRRIVVDAAGKPVPSFPETLTFRVTASTRLKLFDIERWPATAGEDLNRYLLALRFRVRVFRGLHMRTVQPESVTMIGMPADVPYDERVYRVNFNVGQLPMTDRVVFEVLSPKGDRLSRFHLDLQ